jgi:dienelactone hydrolase
MIAVSRREGIFNEQCWNPVSRESCYIISTITGEKKPVNISGVMPSPTGKYLIGYDSLSHDIYSYTGKTQNITGQLPIPAVDSTNDVPGNKYRGLQMAVWLEKDEALLIYDTYDIWMIDPAGIKPPVDITNGYGRKHNIVFRLSGVHFPFGKPVNNKEELILSAFNRITKENGFYSKRLSEKGDPVLLSMGPYLYDVPSDLNMGGMAPLKAKKKNAYLVQRCSAIQSPNYYYTTDFKTFNPITNIYPEGKYNWLSAELLNWKTADGRSLQGVLYKPENFDPQKKYPVILNYYEKMSDYLHEYVPPAATEGLINIPWFVSHGYLIFTPDIYYTIEEPGESACNAIVSAAMYISTFPFVDTSKIGLQGHSWSGYETNYTITHSHLFAAAVAGAGISDMISGYNAIIDQGGVSAQSYYESAQARIGVTLWQRPDLYIKNSPILQADKVTTPLLMMHNKADGLVPFAQGIAFFTALRRLNKKVWLLQYDDGDHHLYGKSAIDYTIRMTQFFDHYLKGLPAPVWMREGIPARLKGL